ncbi:AAA family ATPase [Anaeromicropila populeti]|uniref:ATPase/GTPase, AAA15 family n=1 Tax=Anaeromicropila populeti TaxID=37658 RepID=A0A1I6IWS7_9FIRM|nr:AAA family ATPase [Anaeromicropila populeti]SFR71192.1 ATPase/GTPase, AAA15 family [Anaeromicropila populeti]
MISEIYIENFRGVKNLKLNDLGKINIIAGANNTGKTSILEVIQSLKAPNDLKNWRIIGRREENSPRIVTTIYDTMKSLFPINIEAVGERIKYSGINNGEAFEVEISGQISDTIVTEKQLDFAGGLIYSAKLDIDDQETNNEFETTVMEIQYKINGNKCGKDTVYGMQRGLRMTSVRNRKTIVENIVYISPTQHAQNVVFLNSLFTEPDLYEQFVEIMRQFDPYFISINSIEEENSYGRKFVILSKNHKEGLLLNAYGDGMKKAMLLLSAVIRAKDGILLLDEFETAIHISAMKDVFSWIIDTAVKLNVQIFMTSHSIEAIESVLKCCPVLQTNIRMITLVKVEDEVKVRNVNGEKAVQLLDEYGLELR